MVNGKSRTDAESLDDLLRQQSLDLQRFDALQIASLNAVRPLGVFTTKPTSCCRAWSCLDGQYLGEAKIIRQS